MSGSSLPIDISKDMELIAVRITKATSPYVVGDVAGFSKRDAERLVSQGYGEYLPTKSIDQAPVDKQIKNPKVKKSIE